MPFESLYARLSVWTLICFISAAPSFLLAMTEFYRPDQMAAMLIGVLIFIALYTWATGTQFARRLNRDPLIRRTAFVGYGTRIGISLFWPVGTTLDLFCGAFTGMMLEPLVDPVVGLDSFLGVLIWTLTQGSLLNVVLLAYMLVVYAFLFNFHNPPRKGHCTKCGYDLRASRDRCPECGEAIVAAETDERQVI